MRRLVSTFAIVAILAQGPAVANAEQERVGMPAPPWTASQCAPLAPLPQLGAEQQQARPQNYRPVRRSEPGVAMSEATMAKGEGADASPPPPPPPPPPVMAAPVSEAPVATVASSAPSARAKSVSDSEAASPTGRIMPYPHPMPPRPRPPRPQAGLLTAGEHDDMLNPELYARYVRQSNLGQEIRALPVLDTSRVLTVAVKDDAGRAVPFAKVELACANGRTLTLNTLADGTVAFFPEVDRLSRKVRLRVGGEAWREVAIAPGAGGQRVDFTVGKAAQAVRKLDLMLVIDTTGSMGDELRFLQTELAAILEGLKARHRGLDLRIGFVFYRDLGDEYVTQTVPLTGDFAAAQGTLSQQYASGGGDYPEAMDQAMIRAAGQQWRPDAVHSLLLVADAPPHDDKFDTTWLAARHLRQQRVQIVPVAASGVADKAEYAMRAMAALTQSRYTFLTDDSGIGNPHAPPAIDCYLVTRLDALLRRVIDSQLSGRRIEPDKSEVIRTVGQYDSGRCIIPPGGLQDQ